MLTRNLTAAALVSALALTAGCSSTTRTSYDTVGTAPNTGYSTQVADYGYVRNISTIDARHTSGAGAIIGGVVGAVVGNQIGGGTGRAAATGIGAVGGAIVGNEIEKNRASGQAYRVEVRMDNGDLKMFDYWDLNGLRVGDRVRVVNGQLERY